MYMQQEVIEKNDIYNILEKLIKERLNINNKISSYDIMDCYIIYKYSKRYL